MIVENESLSQEYQQPSLPRAPSQHVPRVLTLPLKGPHHDDEQQDQDPSLVRFLPTHQEQLSPNPCVPSSSSSNPLPIGMHSSLSAMTRENNARQSVFMRRISYPCPDDDTSSRIEPTCTKKSSNPYPDQNPPCNKSWPIRDLDLVGMARGRELQLTGRGVDQGDDMAQKDKQQERIHHTNEPICSRTDGRHLQIPGAQDIYPRPLSKVPPTLYKGLSPSSSSSSEFLMEGIETLSESTDRQCLDLFTSLFTKRPGGTP